MGPVRWFLDALKFCRYTDPDTWIGMVPVSRFSPRLASVSSGALKMSSGIVPGGWWGGEGGGGEGGGEGSYRGVKVVGKGVP